VNGYRMVVCTPGLWPPVSAPYTVLREPLVAAERWLNSPDTASASLWRRLAHNVGGEHEGHLAARGAARSQRLGLAPHRTRRLHEDHADLSRVTGRGNQLDPVLTETALDWYSRNVPADARSERGPFAPVVTVADDADAYIRLVACVGRPV